MQRAFELLCLSRGLARRFTKTDTREFDSILEHLPACYKISAKMPPYSWYLPLFWHCRRDSTFKIQAILVRYSATKLENIEPEKQVPMLDFYYPTTRPYKYMDMHIWQPWTNKHVTCSLKAEFAWNKFMRILSIECMWSVSFTLARGWLVFCNCRCSITLQ